MTTSKSQLTSWCCQLAVSSSNQFSRTTTIQIQICLEGISSQELQDILDYMYNGETNIFQEGLDKFLSIAQRFKIMGLLQNEEDKNDFHNPQTQYQTNKEETLNESLNELEPNNESFEFMSNYVADNPIKGPVSRNINRSISLNVDDVNNINQKADELIETLPDGSLKCTHCGKIASKGNLKQQCRQNMRNHVETHLDGLSFDCKLCGKTFRSRNSYKVHQSVFQRPKTQ